ncbi:MAG: redoxin family protein [Candidatus Pacebacteria bacterium]|nr:redoxin family protein [Candidatus Paceibacterota bacterium]
MILFLISFLAGVLTVLAPCTLSLLPVIVGGNIGEGNTKLHSFVVTLSLGLSVILFTLILKVSTVFINVPQTFWQIFSGVIIFILGFIMLFPGIWESIPLIGKLNLGSNRMLATGYQKKNFTGDIIMGAALGPVFSTCSPTYFIILATVLPKSIGAGLVDLLAYVVGLCGFLLIISILSQKAIEKLGIASDNRGWIKRTIGVIFLILGIAIVFGFDQKIELSLSSHIFDVTKIEQKLLTVQGGNNNSLPVNSVTGGITANPATASNSGATKTDSAATVTSSLSQAARIVAESLIYPKEPEITDPSGFINTDGQPIKLSDFVGKKVVLVDFWTYSCINCLRTLPYVKAWYQKYSDQGLEIISIHTPEFAFEKVQSNVENAVKSLGIDYPVVMDNDYGTWNAFGNEYWPREYLINLDGFIVHDHAGEGDYDVTEQAIQKALAERADILGTGNVSGGTVAPTDAISVSPNQVNSPETYFGSNRNEYLANGTQSTSGLQTLSIPDNISTNSLYLSGTWNFNPEYAETSDTTAKIIYKYDSKNLYFVASSALGANIKILVDGEPLTTDRGADVNADSTALIKDNRLYKIIQGTDYGEHTLEIDVLNGTLDAYTFTFG